VTAKEVIESRLKESFQDAKGNAYQLHLKPGLPQSQLSELEERLAAPLPNEVRELLTFTSGFNFQPFGEVDFSAKEMFGLEEILPLGLTIATDGSGNDWVVDIKKGTGEWGPVLFMSHDPPVAVIQAPDLARFIEQVFEIGRPERKSQLDSVTKAATRRIWSDDPYLLDLRASRMASDPALAEFSKQLPETFHVADLPSFGNRLWIRLGPRGG
jgi:cell wall assembly regulator SMI1